MTPPSGELRAKRNFEKTLKEARIGTLEAQYELALMYANGVGAPVDIAKAIQWLQQAAAKGLSSAQYLLATRYLSGVGVERDETSAMLWLGKAAAQGNTKAVYRLGRFLEAPHRDAALSCLHQAAQAGLLEAQWAWSQAILSGPASPHQQRQAYEFLLAAAEQGMAAAQSALGDLCMQGLPGVVLAANAEQALHWYRRAAAQGSLQAIVALERPEFAGVARANRNPNAKRKAGPERRASLEQWTEAAESGDADTRYHLGLVLEKGYGVAADLVAAEHWYRSAGLQGDARAQLALGRLLEGAGAYEALDWYAKSAEQGNADAQFALARNLSSGNWTGTDSFAGLVWYLRAAEQGHAVALVTVGSLLASDMGHAAHACYERAATLGAAQAQYKVGEALLKSAAPEAQVEAVRWLESAARQGHAGAQCALGLAFLEGRGVVRDAKTAVTWLTRSAEQGEARAQWNLGSLYASGHAAAGLPRDVNQALHWCQQAATQGFAAAQATLGGLYARLERWPQARDWLQKAVDQNDPEALFNLAVLAQQSRFSGIRPELALTYLCRAAELGVVPAQSRLGIVYATGDGAALDPIEAHKWFVIASRRGDKAAQANLLHSEKLIAEAPRREALRRAEEWIEKEGRPASSPAGRMGEL